MLTDSIILAQIDAAGSGAVHPIKLAMLVLDQLLCGLKGACAAFPVKRKSAGVYSMADIELSAF